MKKMKNQHKKLRINQETVRLLAGDQMRRAYGGVITDTDTGLCNGTGSYRCADTYDVNCSVFTICNRCGPSPGTDVSCGCPQTDFTCTF